MRKKYEAKFYPVKTFYKHIMIEIVWRKSFYYHDQGLKDPVLYSQIKNVLRYRHAFDGYRHQMNKKSELFYIN